MSDQRLLRLIEERVETYRRFTAVAASRTRERAAASALAELQSLVDPVVAAWTSMDETTSLLLLDVFASEEPEAPRELMVPPSRKRGIRQLGQITGTLQRMSAIIAAARKNVASPRRGPRPDDDLVWLVFQLATLYTMRTGRKLERTSKGWSTPADLVDAVTRAYLPERALSPARIDHLLRMVQERFKALRVE